MGRKKRVVTTDEPVQPEEGDTVNGVVKASKKDQYTLYAWFAVIDKEGFKVKNEYNSEGETVSELLENLVFPPGVNGLVNVTVTKGSNEISKALAPHKARKILEHKSVVDFENVFRGL